MTEVNGLMNNKDTRQLCEIIKSLNLVPNFNEHDCIISLANRSFDNDMKNKIDLGTPLTFIDFVRWSPPDNEDLYINAAETIIKRTKRV